MYNGGAATCVTALVCFSSARILFHRYSAGTFAMIQQRILKIDRRVSPDHVTNRPFNHVITPGVRLRIEAPTSL